VFSVEVLVLRSFYSLSFTFIIALLSITFHPSQSFAFAATGPVGVGSNAVLSHEASGPSRQIDRRSRNHRNSRILERAATRESQAKYEKQVNHYRQEMIKRQKELARQKKLQEERASKKAGSQKNKTAKKELKIQATPISVCETGSLWLCVNQTRDQTTNDDGMKVIKLNTELVPLCSPPVETGNCTQVY